MIKINYFLLYEKYHYGYMVNSNINKIKLLVNQSKVVEKIEKKIWSKR